MADWLEWPVEGWPEVVRYRPDVLQEISIQMTAGFRAFSWGGVEIGGVLFGTREGSQVSVTDHCLVDIEHENGPSYELTDRDRDSIRKTVDAARSDGLEPVGWYKSVSNRELAVTEGDSAVWADLFPTGILLILKRSKEGVSNGATFCRADGRIRSGRRKLDLSAAKQDQPVPSPQSSIPTDPPLAKPDDLRQVVELQEPVEQIEPAEPSVIQSAEPPQPAAMQDSIIELSPAKPEELTRQEKPIELAVPAAPPVEPRQPVEAFALPPDPEFFYPSQGHLEAEEPAPAEPSVIRSAEPWQPGETQDSIMQSSPAKPEELTRQEEPIELALPPAPAVESRQPVEAFALTPDPEFFYPSPAHLEALASLEYGISHRKGFMMLVSESGMGKTMLLECLSDRLSTIGIEYGFLFSSRLSQHELFELLTLDFDLNPSSSTKTAVLMALNHHLIDRANLGQVTALLIDDAQKLSDEMLGEIELLSNLETRKGKLLQVVMAAHPEFEVRLNRPEHAGLRQRFVLRPRLGAFSSAETEAYIRFRLAEGGMPDAAETLPIEEIHRLSGGVPRLISAICAQVLEHRALNGSDPQAALAAVATELGLNV